MSRELEPEVLVVGAGPVGLMTALRLAEHDVRVRIIDQAERTASHTYGCALHSSSLGLLSRVGLIDEVMRLGQRVDEITLTVERQPEAQIELGRLESEFPYILVLPQSHLESGLEQALLDRHGITVDWNHRLAGIEQTGSEVIAAIDELGYSGKGYSVAEMDWEVQSTRRLPVSYVVGADGNESVVRQSNGISFMNAGPAETFIVYEFDTADDVRREATIVFETRNAHAFWPLGRRACRWTIQVPDLGGGWSDHEKERANIVLVNEESDRDLIRFAVEGIQSKAPWFTHQIAEIDWSTTVQFERKVAAAYGAGRCWLAGDAAHQTSPIGMQSVNVGLSEGEELAERIAAILRFNASPTTLQEYQGHFLREWQRLLGRSGEFIPGPSMPESLRGIPPARLIGCLPATGADLIAMARQIGFVFQSTNLSAHDPKLSAIH